MKFGFELEAFVRDEHGDLVLVPSTLPMDECGWLIEVRSEPNSDVARAVALLQVEVKKVEFQANKKGVIPVYEPLMEIPRDLKVQAARRTGKGILRYQNIYGFQTHRNSTKFQTASLHISFTNETEFHYTLNGVPKVYRHQGFIDHARIILTLDKAFKDEIRAAKRNPGFYEVKGDGRIEYRSLPNNVDLEKVGEVLEGLKL